MLGDGWDEGERWDGGIDLCGYTFGHSLHPLSQLDSLHARAMGLEYEWHKVLRNRYQDTIKCRR
jgi:hypothetical protein